MKWINISKNQLINIDLIESIRMTINKDGKKVTEVYINGKSYELSGKSEEFMSKIIMDSMQQFKQFTAV